MSNPRIIKSLNETPENNPSIESKPKKDTVHLESLSDILEKDGTTTLFSKIEIIPDYVKKPDDSDKSKDNSPKSSAK